MTGGHRALEWLARRHAGESAAYIAAHAGVSKDAVVRATKDYGPFPRPTLQLGRASTMPDRGAERTRRWIEARRVGKTATQIAKEHGVARQTVGSATAEFGPFPAMDVVDRWVRDRRLRRSAHEIAAEHGIPASLVRRHTRAHGPFPHPEKPLPTSVWGIHHVARRAGVMTSTALGWRDRQLLPDPDFVTARGRQLWLVATIEQWLRETPGLRRCPDCGAVCRSVGHHRSAKHPESWAASDG